MGGSLLRKAWDSSTEPLVPLSPPALRSRSCLSSVSLEPVASSQPALGATGSAGPQAPRVGHAGRALRNVSCVSSVVWYTELFKFGSTDISSWNYSTIEDNANIMKRENKYK